MRLKDKTALITGAASGFGRGMAELFAAEGAKVAIVDLNGEGAAQVAETIGTAAMAVTCDVSKAEDVKSAVAASIAQLGHLDIVVNNAGFSHPNQPIMEVDEATFRKVYDVNVLSIFHMTKTVVPHFRSRGNGVILNVGSTAGLRPRPGLTWYNSSKGAVNVMTKSLAVELAPDKIRVCGLAPVMGTTGLLETFMGMPDTPENRARFIETIPLGRLSDPKDIAQAALYLVSDEAAFITGVILEVDGGRTI